MAKNKSFGRGKQFLLIAVILLILGAVLLLSETPAPETISNIVEEPGVVTNVELVGEQTIDAEVIVPAEEETGIMDDAEEEVVVERTEVRQTSGEATDLVRNYFKSYNDKEFAVACGILSDNKCNAKNAGDVNRFGQEFKKMNQGYENLNFWAADATDFHSDVVCVEYDYKYANDPSPLTIHEIMSFYVNEGTIASRVCEKKTADGKDVPCPILAKRDFCL